MVVQQTINKSTMFSLSQLLYPMKLKTFS